MADFCPNCAKSLGFSEPDFEFTEIVKSLVPGTYYPIICEGCGFLHVGLDENNTVVIRSEYHDWKPWDPDEDRELAFSEWSNQQIATENHYNNRIK